MRLVGIENGKALGEMLPCCEYEFEITEHIIEGENTLSVELEDLNLCFGPTPGWENFGGIIRDVSLIYRDDNYISDVFFKTDLCNEYKDAEVSVDVQTDKNTDSLLEISLLDGNDNTVLSYEQIEEDMKMIKSTGSNFVRLVHYPHCKATLDIADKLGLMVSEEPGLWWSDTANEEVANGSLEVLKRTIFRDRNHPLYRFPALL